MLVTHVNHASLLIEDGDSYVLTDPWYLSPAFGAWVQNPSPWTEQIQRILRIPPEKLSVIVSHGHDDHLDEFFIEHHLRGAKFFVPKFRNDALQKRIASLTGTYPQELREAGVTSGAFTFSALINEKFTNYDGIVVIDHDAGCVIHANDNWHSYGDALIDKLLAKTERHPRDAVHFLTQFGIADCFPLNYPCYSPQESADLIEERFDSYATATVSNIRRLGLEHGCYYANQSIYPYPQSYSGSSLYEAAQSYIRSHELPFRQLTPGMSLVGPSAGQGGFALPKDPVGQDLFAYCLTNLEAFVQGKVGKEYRLRFISPEDGHVPEPGAVSFQCDRSTWQRIFIGGLTLEAITIGGAGLIFKPNGRNISDLHSMISRLAYQIQAGIRQNGIRFFGEAFQ